jgi:hypothetical protein
MQCDLHVGGKKQFRFPGNNVLNLTRLSSVYLLKGFLSNGVFCLFYLQWHKCNMHKADCNILYPGHMHLSNALPMCKHANEKIHRGSSFRDFGALPIEFRVLMAMGVHVSGAFNIESRAGCTRLWHIYGWSGCLRAQFKSSNASGNLEWISLKGVVLAWLG